MAFSLVHFAYYPVLLKHIVSSPLADIANMSIETFGFPAKLKRAKDIPILSIRAIMKRTLETTGQYPYSPFSTGYLKKTMYHRLKGFLDRTDIVFKS